MCCFNALLSRSLARMRLCTEAPLVVSILLLPAGVSDAIDVNKSCVSLKWVCDTIANTGLCGGIVIIVLDCCRTLPTGQGSAGYLRPLG